MRLVYVQYGCFRTAYQRLRDGGAETFMAQRFTVDFVCGLAEQCERLTVIALDKAPYRETLDNGIETVGLPLTRFQGGKPLVELLADLRPTHFVPRTPERPMLRWAVRNRIRTLPLFADSFVTTTLRSRIRNWEYAHLLGYGTIEFVGNHNVASSRQLQGIGVRADKVLPWDWPREAKASATAAKALERDGRAWRLIYVGKLVDEKGVPDAIAATAELRGQGHDVSLTIAGRGRDEAGMRDAVAREHLGDHVQFLGSVDNHTVVEHMRGHDLVLVPSRLDYPEGMPNVIDEALASGTPLVTSAHPSFAARLVDGNNAAQFEPGRPDALARRIREVMQDAALYARLSENGIALVQNERPLPSWRDIQTRWLRNDPDDQHWLRSQSLAFGGWQ